MVVLRELVSAGGACAAGAGGVLSWAAVSPSSQIFGPTLRRTGDARTMALTFDDGPNPATTPQILDLLDRYGAKATFFVIGKWVDAEVALTQEIVARGHVLANHTYTHPRLALCSSARIAEELERCDAAIESATMRKPRWMRPPYGFRSPLLAGVVRERGDSGIVMWSTWARDWKPQPARQTIDRLYGAQGGDIVLLHDGDPHAAKSDRSHVVAALEHWLPRWQDAGLCFATIDTMDAAEA